MASEISLHNGSPFHRQLERPAMCGLLEPLLSSSNSLSILDLCAGTGFYSYFCAERGHKVLAIDRDAQRLAAIQHANIQVLQADVSQPLAVAAQSIDLVIAGLCFQQMEQLEPLFKQLQLCLQGGGRLLFSVHHPFYTWQHSRKYFQHHDASANSEYPRFQRSISGYMRMLHEAGFAMERLLEPLPTADLVESDAELHQHYSSLPHVLIVQALKI